MVRFRWGRTIVDEYVSHCVPSIIKKLAKCYEYYRSLVNNMFSEDPEFALALQRAFITIMSMRHVTSPEYTDDIGVYHAQQVDGAEVQLSQEFAELLSSKDDDDMVLEKLKPLVALFAHCSERDAYIALHTEFLGRRLLLNKSVSICRERQIMQRLQDCFDTCTIGNTRAAVDAPLTELLLLLHPTLNSLLPRLSCRLALLALLFTFAFAVCRSAGLLRPDHWFFLLGRYV